MTPEERLAQFADAMDAAGVESLVLGGHAVRYYGIGRNTVDYDFYTSSPSVADLRERLARVPVFDGMREGPSWRPVDFARFEVGRLADGREEWLEFWLRNHLLDEFSVLRARQERGEYGGRIVSFVSLPDLLRSKETERESDWLDIALLEEVQDARLLAQATSPAGVQFVLENLRSRRGFERALQDDLLSEAATVSRAAQHCHHVVTYAFLRPVCPDLPLSGNIRGRIEPILLEPLRTVELGSQRHMALVEIVRRAYKRWAMNEDRQDKEMIRRRHSSPP